MKITFLHPDLGIGGAERLVVDAALALRNRGHDVKIVTNQFSKKHCFTDLLPFTDVEPLTKIARDLPEKVVEARTDKKKDITVVGGFPRTFFGRFYAFCAYVRICIAAIFICLKHDADVVFCDQISAPLFLLALFSNAKLFFYCHYPDQLLTTRKSMGKKLYRTVIDQIETWTIGLADVIFVNSRYTESVFKRVFPALANRELEILYPSLNTAYFDSQNEDDDVHSGLEVLSEISPQFEYIFLSLNRFEIKKNIELAVRSFAMLKEKVSEDVFSKCLLVLAGGYDVLNNENILYHKYLKKIVEELDLQDSVVFVLSPGDYTKIQLLKRAHLVVYTPENEHFGIVPIEAMYLKRPVLACNSGGPKETILDGETGFLCAQTPEEFAEVMFESIEDPVKIQKMGENGRRRVIENFSFVAFTEKLDRLILENRTP